MFTVTVNGILVDGIVGTFDETRARAHLYFLELMQNGFLRTMEGIVHGEEIELTPVEFH